MFRICRVLPLVALLALPALAGDDSCPPADCQDLAVGSACEAACLAHTAERLIAADRVDDLLVGAQAQTLAALAAGERSPAELDETLRRQLVTFARIDALATQAALLLPVTSADLDRTEARLPGLVRADSPTAHHVHAVLSLARGQDAQALRLVESALESGRDDADALALRGFLRSRQDDLDREQSRLALRDLHRALELDPDHVMALTCLGEALVAQDQSRYARQYLDKAIALAPGYARARTQRALLALDLQDWDQAEADARAAVELADGRGWHQATRMLCVVQLARGSWEAANELSNDLTRIDGDDPLAWFARSISAGELGLPAEASMAHSRWQATASDADREFLAAHLPERLAEQVAHADDG